jgi:hypothetical protein
LRITIYYIFTLIKKWKKVKKIKINTEAFKKSHYIIQQVNDGYAIKDIHCDKFIDLTTTEWCIWEKNSEYIKDCVGTVKTVIAKLNNFLQDVHKQTQFIVKKEKIKTIEDLYEN